MTSFKISNDTGKDIEIIHEPECFEYIMLKNEEILVETDSCNQSVELRISKEGDKVIISILNENSLYRVLKGGNDVFAKYM